MAVALDRHGAFNVSQDRYRTSWLAVDKLSEQGEDADVLVPLGRESLDEPALSGTVTSIIAVDLLRTSCDGALMRMTSFRPRSWSTSLTTYASLTKSGSRNRSA